MEIQPKQPSTKGPAEMFTGDVWFDVVAKGEEPSRMRVNMVRFAPCARTAWHSHAVGQTLHVTEGRGRIQSRGGEVIEIGPGDTIYTPPNEWTGTVPRRTTSCRTLQDDGEAQWLAQERPAGRFMRQLALGDGLDVTGIHANYENGVLTLTIPVSERSKPRKIQVQSQQHGARQVTAGPGTAGRGEASSPGTQDRETQAQGS